jgi:molybdenum cofactor cytidylyltransferase
MSAAISAIVLAAGMATRMGRLKQLLPFRGKILLEHVLDTLRSAGVEEIVVVLGFQADQIRSQVPLDSFKVVLNAAYREGMASSLQAGIAALSPDREAALIMLADQPLVQPGTIHQLMAAYRQARLPFTIPVYDGQRGNPVLIDRTVFPDIFQLSGDTGCRKLFPAYREQILEVPVDDPGVLLDIDTQEDLTNR